MVKACKVCFSFVFLPFQYSLMSDIESLVSTHDVVGGLNMVLQPESFFFYPCLPEVDNVLK